MSEPLIKRLAEFFRDGMTEAFDGCDWEAQSSYQHAESLGLIVKTKYDPEVHGVSDVAEPGDDWFVISPEVQAVLK